MRAEKNTFSQRYDNYLAVNEPEKKAYIVPAKCVTVKKEEERRKQWLRGNAFLLNQPISCRPPYRRTRRNRT